MRLLLDECIPGQFVTRLRLDGHDVAWGKDVCPGAADKQMLARSVAEERIVLTEDRDFGELTVRFRLPAVGVVIAAIGEFASELDAVAEHVARVVRELGTSCVGAISVIEPGRVRQRRL